MDGRELRGSSAEDGRVRQGKWVRYSYDYISSKGLGCEPPAVLGHTDSDGLLRMLRRRAGSAAGERIAGGAAASGRHHAAGRISTGPRAGVCEYDLPEVRWTRAPRDGHDGHVRRFELVLLPLYGCEEF